MFVRNTFAKHTTAHHISLWLAVIGIITLIISLTWLGIYSDYLNPSSATSKQITLAGIAIVLFFWGLLISAFRLKHLMDSHIELLRDLRTEIGFLFTNGPTALCASASFSIILISIYLILVSLTDGTPVFSQVIATTFGIFTATSGIILGFHLLYVNVGPIVGTIKLIESVNKDLITLGKSEGPVYFIYPALNLSFYREYSTNSKNIWKIMPSTDGDDKYLFVEGHPLTTLRNTIRDRAANNEIKKVPKAITYPQELYGELYKVYIKGDNNNEETLKACKESAKEMLEAFHHKKTISPGNFPQHMIIVDSNIYFIHSYGLPMFTPETKTFFMPEEKEPADIISWKYKDEKMAKMIINHIEKIVAEESSP